MHPSLNELAAAWPRESTKPREAVQPAEIELRALLEKAAQQPVPTMALHRLWAIGGLQAYIAFAYTAWWIKGWFADAHTRQQRLVDANLRTALRLLRSMTYLRGAVMKVGQTLANYPQVVPAEFVATLDRLHFQAPPMHYSLLREMVRNELGGDPQEVFAWFDTQAFAAASLGQVHRARLKSGEEVAVKIQYPGIARAIEADFKSLAALLFPLRLTRDWDRMAEMFRELQRMLRLEADYEQEAANLGVARELFDADEGIVVPRVYDTFSTKSVLTMDFIGGQDVESYGATQPTQLGRDRYGELLYRAQFRIYYSGRMNYADPHPGNFVFLSDGRLGLIDFGCMWRFTEKEWAFNEKAERYVHDASIYPELAREGGFLTDAEATPERIQMMRDYSDWLVGPLWHDGPFDFSDPEHLRRGFDIWMRLVMRRYTKGWAMFPFLFRWWFGTRAMMYRLGARVDVKRLHAEERARAVA